MSDETQAPPEEAAEPERPFLRRKPQWAVDRQIRKTQVRQTDVRQTDVRKPFTLKSQPNWENEDFVDVEGEDRLAIPKEIVRQIQDDYGLDLMWIPNSVRGQVDPQYRAMFERQGWTSLHQEDLEGVFDGMFMRRGDAGEITVGDCVLAVRPLEISRRAREREARKAAEPIELKRHAAMTGELPGVPGSDHPSARSKNQFNLSREAVPIPDE